MSIEEILVRLNNLEAKVDSLTEENITLKENITELNDYADECDEKIITLEDKINKLDQYIRRENIVISGIPENISHNDLENKVINLLNSIDVRVIPSDIQACHRLAKNKYDKVQPPKVIVRFHSRKAAIDCLKKRKNLLHTYRDLGYENKLFINENLCPAYQKVFDECRYLRTNGKISSFWSYNGMVNIKFSEDKAERPTKVFHIDGLYNAIDDNEWEV